MPIEMMRAEISKVYPNQAWKRKVACMYDNQVIAVYYDFLKRGMFKQKPKNTQSISKQSEPQGIRATEDFQWVQMSVFDFLKGDEKK